VVEPLVNFFNFMRPSRLIEIADYYCSDAFGKVRPYFLLQKIRPRLSLTATVAVNE